MLANEAASAVFICGRSKRGARTDGQHGDRVHVSGRVKEFHGLTELTDITSITRCGNGRLPEPVSVTLPWQDGEPPEHLENMRINVAGELTVINHYNPGPLR